MRREGEGRVAGWLPVRPDTVPGGRVGLGTLGFLCDSVGGHICGLAVAPRWVVTTDVDVRRVGSARVAGPLRALGGVERAGRTSVVASLEVRDLGDSDRLVAVSTVASTPLDPTFVPFVTTLEEGVAWGSGPEPVDPPPFARHLGLEPDRGRLTFDMPGPARNPWGIMHGGVVIEAMARTGVSGAREALDAAVVATALHTRLLNGAKVGPFQVRSEVLDAASSPTSGPVRLTMVDAGADRTVAVGILEARVDEPGQLG